MNLDPTASDAVVRAVTVTVTCTIDNSDLVTVGIPGALQVSHSATSTLDAYRLRS